ncbi:MAG: hypothetical protein E7388_00595 [Ruminococcaceae bacterium]|nr:hypothetical protein [Oscillospiraceae bacterium]
MDIVIKIAATAILVSSIGMLIRSIRPELSVPVSVATVVVIALAMVPELVKATELAKSFTDNKYMETVFKITGIAYITHFTGDICRSAGEGALALGVELSGKIAVMLLTLPLAGNLVNLAKSFI